MAAKDCLRIIQTLAAVDRTLEMTHVLVLMHIGEHNADGVTVPDLQFHFRLPASTSARTVMRLGAGSESSSQVGQALNLIRSISDPQQANRKRYFLSAEGEKLWKELTGQDAPKPRY